MKDYSTDVIRKNAYCLLISILGILGILLFIYCADSSYVIPNQTLYLQYMDGTTSTYRRPSKDIEIKPHINIIIIHTNDTNTNEKTDIHIPMHNLRFFGVSEAK